MNATGWKLSTETLCGGSMLRTFVIVSLTGLVACGGGAEREVAIGGEAALPERGPEEVETVREEFSFPEPKVVEEDGIYKIISGNMAVPATEVGSDTPDPDGVDVNVTMVSGGDGGGVIFVFFKPGMDEYAKGVRVNGRSMRATTEIGNMWMGPPRAIPALANADSLRATLGALRWVNFTPNQLERIRTMARMAQERGAPTKPGPSAELYYD